MRFALVLPLTKLRNPPSRLSKHGSWPLAGQLPRARRLDMQRHAREAPSHEGRTGHFQFAPRCVRETPLLSEGPATIGTA